MNEAIKLAIEERVKNGLTKDEVVAEFVSSG
jgi:hypothetical protein